MRIVERTSHIPAGEAKGRRTAILIWLSAALVLLMLGAALVGAYPIGVADLLEALWRHVTYAGAQGRVDTVLFDIRLPRI